jgi:hypothetical protein
MLCDQANYQTHSAANTELVVQPYHVGMHRVARNAQSGGDSQLFLIVEDCPGNLQLALGENQPLGNGCPLRIREHIVAVAMQRPTATELGCPLTANGDNGLHSAVSAPVTKTRDRGPTPRLISGRKVLAENQKKQSCF